MNHITNTQDKVSTGVNSKINSASSNPLCSTSQSCPPHTFQHIPMTWLSLQGIYGYDDDDDNYTIMRKSSNLLS